MNYQHPELRRALAADYAVGLMTLRVQRRFERLLELDPALRMEVVEWQKVLLGLTDNLPEQQVAERVWQAIQTQLGPETPPQTLGEAAIDIGADAPQKAEIPTAKEAKNKVIPLRRKPSIRSWYAVAAAACVLAVTLLLGQVFEQDRQYASATLVASDQHAALSIKAYSGYLQVEPLVLSSAQTNSSLELWAIAANGKPVSLGLLPNNGRGQIDLSDVQRKLLKTPVTLAVSLEPQGGSPTGLPTGPVLYQGQLAQL